MSVSVSGGGGRGGKKSLHADLNLVPYIDLLTCMVSFLLITAVWTQLARLPAQQKNMGQSGEQENIPTPQVKIVVLVNDLGYSVITDTKTELPKKGEDYDVEGLVTELKKLKQQYPDKNDAQVASDDAIKFDNLVKAMDASISAGFPDISLVDSAGI